MESNEMNQPYDITFYEEQSPYSLSSAHKVVPYLSKLLPNITSVIDVGCGIGGWLYEWKQEGKNVFGIDGNDLPKEKKKIIENEYLKHDLFLPLPKLYDKYDLCMSLEVAEHLPPERADSFVKDLCFYSNIVLFSAAIPGQTGVNHINEQWPNYWAEKFKINGYKAYDILRNIFWEDADVAWWYAQNMILYLNSNAPPPVQIMDGKVFSLVHPKCFMMYYPQMNKQQQSLKILLIQKIKNCIKKILFPFKKIIKKTINIMGGGYLYKKYKLIFDIFTHLTDMEKITLYKKARKLQKKANIVEIGSYLGASSCFLAAGLKSGNVYCIDTWQNYGMTEGNRDTYTEFLNNTQLYKNKIVTVRGLSYDVINKIEELTNKKIDLLFIDGDHSYEGVKKDWELYSPLLDKGAIVIFHDYGWAEGVKKIINDDVMKKCKKYENLPNMWWGYIK